MTDITTEDILNSINKANNVGSKLPMQTLGMPGASHIMGLANKIAEGVPGYASDIFQRMKRAVTQGPYSSPTGEYDPSIGTLPMEVMSPGFGRAAGLAAFGGRKGPQYVSAFTPQMQSTIKNLVEKYKDVSQPGKLIARDFRGIHPDYAGSDGNLQKTISKIKNWGGANIEGGAKSTTDMELGAFGGQGRLKTDSPGEAINRLQEQIPVTKEWVENWAKDTGVNIKDIKTVKKTESGQRRSRPTYYMELEDPSNPGNIAKVRVPTDPLRHAGYATKNKAGQYYDTGLPTIDPKTGAFVRTPLEDNLINQGGMPYANREALDEALRLKFSKAPYGQNWLTSPDAAPRITPPGQPTPPNIKPDPNQLKLLSSGITPYDILKVLEQQNGQR